MPDYFISYAEANLVCLILFGIMLSHDLFNVDRQEKQVKYDHALIAFMLYFFSDLLWVCVDAGVLPRNTFTVVATNFSNYVIMAAITHMWLRFVMAVEQAPHRERPINKFAVIFPFLVSTVILFGTYLLRPQALISKDLVVQPSFNVFLVAVPYIYIIAVLLYSMKKAFIEENPMEKRKHLFIGLFPLLVIMGGLSEMLFLPKTPIFCFCCTILMMTFYIQSMDRQISMDPLTNLNNRGQLLRYVSQRSNLHLEGRKTYVLMMDINDFKSINDTHGHAEGDHALILLANSLKKVVSRYSMPIFLGRFGGDEFVLIAHPVSQEAVSSLIGDIRSQIEAACRRENAPYILSVGIGCDELLSGQDTFQKCMQRADHKLYLDKAQCKRQGQSTVCRKACQG